jgi:hypothetical protein
MVQGGRAAKLSCARQHSFSHRRLLQVNPVRRPQPVAVEATGWLLDRYRAGVARASTTFPEDEVDFAASIVCCSRRVGLNSLNSLLPGIHTWYK